MTGLPPTPKELNEFLGDTRANAYERLIDLLLSSKQYGVRWARHWLDSAGYTDTTGQETVFAGIWRYRDYVVDSLNSDKPCDEFLIEQIAGDELVDWRSAQAFTPEVVKLLVATGYLRSTLDRTDADITNLPQERYDVLIDLVDKVSTGVLGLTVGCARCHSHKFDPIPQRDYYRLMAVFSSSYNPWNWTTPQKRFIAAVPKQEREAIDRHNAGVDERQAEVKKQIGTLRAPYDAKIFEKKLLTLPAEIREEVKVAVKLAAEERDEIQRFLARKFAKTLTVEPAESEAMFSNEDKGRFRELDGQVKALERTRKVYEKIQALWDTGPPPKMRLLQRGVLATPGPTVEPGLLTVLSAPGQSDVVRPTDTKGETSGQRLAFGRWLVSRDHPLTARVMVNRIWQHHLERALWRLRTTSGGWGPRRATLNCWTGWR